MPPDRLVALTYCIRASFLGGELEEANLLLKQRSLAVQSMIENRHALTLEEHEAIQRADSLLIETLKQQQAQIGAKLRQDKVARRVKRAYSAS